MTTSQIAFAGKGITPFNFGDHPVRVVDRDGEPWFVAADVCAAIGLSNPWDALGKLDADEKGLASTETLGGRQELNIINESGLFTLILRCRDATTPGTAPHRFRKWVTSEVLPNIRKTGRYELKPMTEMEFLVKIAQKMLDQENCVIAMAKEQSAQKAVQEEQKAIQVSQQNQIDDIATRQADMDGDTGYMTVLAFCRSQKIDAPLDFARRFGLEASRRCRSLGIRIGKISDERWKNVNSYPVKVLIECCYSKQPNNF
ncbi:MAG: Bro-N domain-containing protein [Magnetococcus sp. YQC-5]